MKTQLSDVERKVLALLQDGLPASGSPYKDLAEQAGIEVEKFLNILRDWKQQGKIRRIGAIVNHFKVGFGSGGMVVWRVASQRLDEVGSILAGFKEVSHAYERRTTKDWLYNVYTMVHGASLKDVQEIVQKMSRACGVCDYRILVTEKELKKASPRYIT